VHKIPILGKINIEKFIDIRSNELPAFSSFRQEWREGRGLFEEEFGSTEWLNKMNIELNKCEHELTSSKNRAVKKFIADLSMIGLGIGVDFIYGNLTNLSLIKDFLPIIKLIHDISDYKDDIPHIKLSAPFFLLNVLDKNTNRLRTDNPGDMPEKPPIDIGSLVYKIPAMNSRFF